MILKQFPKIVHIYIISSFYVWIVLQTGLLKIEVNECSWYVNNSEQNFRYDIRNVMFSSEMIYSFKMWTFQNISFHEFTIKEMLQKSSFCKKKNDSLSLELNILYPLDSLHIYIIHCKECWISHSHYTQDEREFQINWT